MMDPRVFIPILAFMALAGILFAIMKIRILRRTAKDRAFLGEMIKAAEAADDFEPPSIRQPGGP